MSGIFLLSVGNSYGSKPENETLPVINDTTPSVGQTISTSTGNWAGTEPITFAYQWLNNGSNISGATSSSYTVQASDEGDTLSVRVTASNSVGDTSATSASTSAVGPNVGQQEFTSSGTFSWVAPAGVTSVSAVAVGGGGGSRYVSPSGGDSFKGGGGGALAYVNNYSVTPGNSYTVVVGDRGISAGSINATSGENSSFASGVCEAGGGEVGNTSSGTRALGGAVIYGSGGAGGQGGAVSSDSASGGGGGAGGYSGAGGNGASYSFSTSAGVAGSGGGGGGGASRQGYDRAGGGGGVGILGEGSSGAGGAVNSGSTLGQQGGGGSGGSGGGNTLNGGTYGGGTGGFTNSSTQYPGRGAVRIIWPGNTRQFPSTDTGNL